MRKRLPLCAAAAAVLLILLSGCAAAEQAYGENRLEVYYRRESSDLSDGSAIGKVGFSVNSEDDRLHQALSLLMSDPEREDLFSAFPADVRIESYNLDEAGEISVIFGDGYSDMSPARRTLARCCLVLTLCDLEEVESVSIYEGDLLLETGLTQEILLLESTGESAYQVDIALWYPDAEEDYLVSVRRQLTIGQFKPLAEYAVEELLRGEQEYAVRSALPAGTQLYGVKLSDGLCTVDFSQEFLRRKPQTAAEERLSIYALVNTLTELDDVERVQITVEGERLGSYLYMDLSAPLERTEAFSAATLSSCGWYTVNVYLKTADGALVAVPVPLEKPDMEHMTEQTLQILLEQEDLWGYRRSVPKGVTLLNCQVDEARVCTLQLSPEFLVGSRRETEIAAQALAATAADAGGVSAVRIFAGGSYYLNGELIEKDSEWIVD